MSEHLFYLLFKEIYCSLGILPFMVVGAMAWATPWLLLPAHINSQVINIVVCLIAIHVVYAFFRSQRSSKMSSHYKTMFKNWLSTALHFSIHWQEFVRNTTWRDKSVTAFRYCYNAISSTSQPICTVFNRLDGTWPTKTTKVVPLTCYPNLSGWPCSYLTASLTNNINHNARRVVTPVKSKARHDSGMLDKRSEIGISTATKLTNDFSNASKAITSEFIYLQFPPNFRRTKRPLLGAHWADDIYKHTTCAFVWLRNNCRMRKWCEIYSHVWSPYLVLNRTIYRSSYITY